MNNRLMAQALPKTIGRFEIIRVLGEGSQGTVYLANDPRLQRQVAIKSLRIAEAHPEQVQALINEARIVSKLQHPNIVALFDAIEHAGQHYLVFEYVAGMTLAGLIRKDGRLEKNRAVSIVVALLDGIAYAHGKGVIHRDMKPSNIMLDGNGVPRIMDFGIATTSGAQQESQGTPNYMAPESITNKASNPGSDIFAVGMVLYAMLTGKPAAQGTSVKELLHNIVNTPFALPSEANPEVDEQLDGIVMQALAKNPRERYADAHAMRQALENYLNPKMEAGATEGDSKQSTLEFLLRRMRHKSDLPALSQAIQSINDITASDNENLHTLSSAILKDFALTNKLLKMLNTATYSQFQGSISTVSRAVAILGFDGVRNLAMSLILFENLQNKAQAAQLSDELVGTFLNGLIAKRIAGHSGVRDAEEGFVCAMFHHLGRLLTTFYLHEESVEVKKRMQQQGISEETASAAVLGLSYEDLGIGVARSWHFPEKIVASMRRVKEDRVRKSSSESERLRIIADLSCALGEIAANTPPEEKSKRLKALSLRFSDSLLVSEKELGAVVEESVGEFLKEALLPKLNTSQSDLLNRFKQWTGNASTHEASPVPAIGDDTLERSVLESTALEATIVDIKNESEDAEAAKTRAASHAALSAGIQDITNTLVDNFDLSNVLNMILETMYRGMGFDRVLLCVRDIRSNTMPTRLGFGNDVESILKTFVIPLEKTHDVFQVAVNKNADIFIANINDDNIRSHIPDWYRKVSKAETFMLLPIAIDKKPFGMMFAAKDQAGKLVIQPNELSLIKTLRNQAVLAIRQKRQPS